MFSGLVVPGNLRLGVQHEHAVLNSIKKRLEKITLACQTSHHGLQPLRIELINAPGNSIEKTGAFRRHILLAPFCPAKKPSLCERQSVSPPCHKVGLEFKSRNLDHIGVP